MNLETFFEKFELFADAPDAVRQVREPIHERQRRSILQPRVGATQERLPWDHRKTNINPNGVASSGPRWMQPLQGWLRGGRVLPRSTSDPGNGLPCRLGNAPALEKPPRSPSMTTETFFEKFEIFADAPGAANRTQGLVLDYSANGALHTSLGQRPRKTVPHSFRALMGRPNAPLAHAIWVLDRGGWVAPSGRGSFVDATPRALPWAGVGRRVAAGRTTR